MSRNGPGPGGRPVRLAATLNRIGLPLVPMLVLAAGCTAHPTPAPSAASVAVPVADCTALTAPPPAAPRPAAPSAAPAPSATAPSAGTPATPASVGVGGGGPLPDLSLPCLGSGRQLRLAALRGPAVVNLWASWCPPCREELPALQRYADRAAGTVHVLGVVTMDDPGRAAGLAADLGVTFPSVTDPTQQVLKALPAKGLPATVLVDANGRIRHVHNGPPLAEAAVAALVAEHLGVTVGA